MSGYSKVIVGLMFATLFLGSFSAPSQIALSDGPPSGDPLCFLLLKNDSTPTGPPGDNEKDLTLTTGSTDIITEICIKAGNEHPNSLITSNGVTGDGCYLVSGLGTPTVNVLRILSSNVCQGISHVDGNSVPPPQQVCGNKIVEFPETCDDGNTQNGDGCSDKCEIESPPQGPFCGDGILDPNLGEQCDDGNNVDGDGCSAVCEKESPPQGPFCGDGILDPNLGEQCDDGNNVDGDGCSAVCTLEGPISCEDSCSLLFEECLVITQGNQLVCLDRLDICLSGCFPPLPQQVCGNKIVEFPETCDDGNTTPGDGCDASCQTELPPTLAACKVLVIDEDSIDNDGPYYIGGTPVNFGGEEFKFIDIEVNDDIAEIGVRDPLPFFSDDPELGHAGEIITLLTGQMGDEAWFALKTIPASWDDAGPTADGASNFFAAGPGLGTEDGDGNRETLLDKIPDVTPLRAEGLHNLIGQNVCAVVYDSDVSINYDPINGSLKGANYGIVAFKVISVTAVAGLDGFSDSSLPEVEIEILDAEELFQGELALCVEAPELLSSSEHVDVIPDGSVPDA